MLLKGLLVIIRHEICATMREGFAWLTPLLFFIIVVCLFPVGLNSDPSLLSTFAPGIIWIIALLAIIISIDSLFQQDANEGFLDLLLLSSYPLTLLVFCKVVSHWITHCLPLVLVSPLLCNLLNLPQHEIMILVLTLLLGTPVLSILGCIGAALLVGARSHSMLLPVLIMPFYIPVLIFGTGTIITSQAGQPIGGYVAIMGALLLLSIAFAPLLSGVALRIGVNKC